MASNGILRFEPNKPERVALAGTPEETESMFGTKPEWKCQLVDGRLVYLKEAVKAQLDEMGIRVNEPIEITQTLAQLGHKRSINWRVRRVEEEQRPGSSNGSSVSPAAAATLAGGAGGATPAAPQTQNISYTRIMTQCWIASIDAMILAEQYAKEKGIAFHITEESLRCSANAIFIAYDKRNGGAR